MSNKKHFKKIEKKIFKAYENSTFVLGNFKFSSWLKFIQWLSQNFPKSKVVRTYKLKVKL